jgi:hypothetical protein
VVTRLDHLVVLVRDLDGATRDYEELGFAVTPGGEHADGLTHNALIPFRDGSYPELVASLDPDDSRDNVWGWRPTRRGASWIRGSLTGSSSGSPGAKASRGAAR